MAATVNLPLVNAIRAEIEAFIAQEGENGLALLQSEIASGTLTGAFAQFQAQYAEIKLVVGFLGFLARLKSVCPIAGS